jgi:hypothetical protein
MTQCSDPVVCLVVSLCEDYVDFCVKTMYCFVKTGFSLIYALLC